MKALSFTVAARYRIALQKKHQSWTSFPELISAWSQHSTTVKGKKAARLSQGLNLNSFKAVMKCSPRVAKEAVKSTYMKG